VKFTYATLFKTGFKQGHGAKGADGDVYDGQWFDDKAHG
jgi:hypothetical protein